MKTLSDFKKELTIGSKWQAFYIPTATSLGVGEVVTVQSNAVAFKREGKENPSWLYFPKASDLKARDGFAEIYWRDGKHVLTYKKVS